MNIVSHNNQKKIALVNDFTGFGRCSIAVQLPLISALKVQCCPLPTAVFSNHTGFESFVSRDLTDDMVPWMQEWKKLDLRFDAILTGFLNSTEQIALVSRFIDMFRDERTVTIIDPVMGDHGKRYRTYTPEMCDRMKSLCEKADLLTPNLTEACLLTDTAYREDMPRDEVEQIARKLIEQGCKKAVITGIVEGNCITNLCLEEGAEPEYVTVTRLGNERSGTGDLFSAILAAETVRGASLLSSVKKASEFIKHCIQRAIDMDIPLTDGVPFEELLTEI
ncbi:MAG: pyridoxamine kinase [Clostridia bacterium]|nr:pyridoxamine kinase [Clostridia bacterium]